MTGEGRGRRSIDHDGLDELLRHTLRREGLSGAAAAGGDIGRLLARGRARRRRRTVLASGAGVVIVALLALVAGAANRPDDRVRVAVGGGTSEPVATSTPGATAASPATASTVSTAVSTVSTEAPASPVSIASTASPVSTEASTAVSTPPSVGAVPGSVEIPASPDFVAVRNGQFEVFAHGAPVERFDPCDGTAGCDVPIVSLGADLFYLRRTATARAVLRHSSLDGTDVVVAGPGTGGTIVDVAYGGRTPSGFTDGFTDRWYTIETAAPSEVRGSLLELDRRSADSWNSSLIADRVYEVAATTEGRLAWVTDAGIVVRDPAAGTASTIGLGRFAGRPTQLSFGPAGTTWLLVRAPGDPGTRLVLDTATAATLDDARSFAATAACWSSAGPIIGYTGSVAAAGGLVRVDPGTGASTPYFAGTYRTEQIACADDGTIALVDLGDGGGQTGDLVLVGTDGTPTRIAGPYERVRSIR